MRAQALAKGVTPTIEMLEAVDKDLALILSINSYSSVRRGVIRRAVEYSDSIPGKKACFDASRILFLGMEEWKRAHNLGAAVHTNEPAREALRLIGGGATALALEAEKNLRISGGRGNLARILFNYSLIQDPHENPLGAVDVGGIAERLFSLKKNGKIKMLSASELDAQYKMMANTSSGFFFQRFFRLAPKRLGYIMQHSAELNRIARLLEEFRLGATQQILLPWIMASRGKMVEISEIDEKMQEEKPLSRGVMVGEPSEHYLFYAIYKPVFDRIRDLLRVGDPAVSPIKIGIRKNSQDWPKLQKHLKKWTYVMTTDWSGFDSSVRPKTLRKAWEVLIASLDLSEEKKKTLALNLTNLYQNNFVNGLVFHAGYVLGKRGGIPSGSVFTSIIGSVVNFLVLNDLLSVHKHVRAYEIFVYGDDAIVGLEAEGDICEKFTKRAFLHQLRSLAEQRHGMKLSEKKTEIARAADNYYMLVQPRFGEPEDVLRKGTRGLKPIGYRQVDEFNFTEDYENGYTHRAQYKTRNAVHFLGKSFDRWGRPITTTLETITRMLNPENGVNNIVDAKRRAIEYACDNVHNRLLTNQLKYVFLALNLMEKELGCGISRWPRVLSQKMYPTEQDIEERRNAISPDGPIRILPDGALRVFFRAEEGYIDLMENEETRRWILEFESELAKRTGWQDVATDWERLHLAGRAGAVGKNGNPKQWEKWGWSSLCAGPENERVKNIDGPSEEALRKEYYFNKPGNLGSGSPDVVEDMVERVLKDEQDCVDRGFVSGCLLNVWPKNARKRADYQSTINDMITVVERVGPFAVEIEDGVLIWEENVPLVFLGEKPEGDWRVEAWYAGIGNEHYYGRQWGSFIKEKLLKEEAKRRISAILEEYRVGDNKQTWLFRRKRIINIIVFLNIVEEIIQPIDDEKLKNSIIKKYVLRGPDNVVLIARDEKKFYNKKEREEWRFFVSTTQLTEELKLLKKLLAIGHIGEKRKKKEMRGKRKMRNEENTKNLGEQVRKKLRLW